MATIYLDWRYPERSISQLQEKQPEPDRAAQKPEAKMEIVPESESEQWVRERMNEALG
jgi:hypothetical protein